MTFDLVIVALVFAFLTLVVTVVALRYLLHVATPEEALIIAGSRRDGGSGHTYGFRLVVGGRAIKLPFIELADRLDLSPLRLEIAVSNAISQNFVPLAVTAVAQVKIPSTSPCLERAAEQLLGKSREEIATIATDVIEGEIHAVLGVVTPEEASADTEKLTHVIIEESDLALTRLGMRLDTFEISSLGDDLGYLEAMARARRLRLVS